MLLSAGAVDVEARLASAESEDDRLRYRQLQNIVDEMAIAAGLPRPKAYVIPDGDPNAFATGRDPAHASIAVTDGLLARVNREELQGVVAHEMGHIRNLDIRLMTVVAAMVGAVLLLADWSGRALRFGGGSRRGRSSRDKDGSGGLGVLFFVVWIVAIVVAPVVGRLLATTVSRRREYLADATGAELTRNPLALAARSRRSRPRQRPRPASNTAPRTSASRILSAGRSTVARGAGRTSGRRTRRWPSASRH